MRSYLSLIPLSAKVRKRQNRMIILCIVISVLLVTAIFSIADMVIRTESSFILKKHGNWHIQLENVSQDIVKEISERPDVTAVGVASVFNFDAEQSYHVNEKKAVLYGTDEIYMIQISNGVEEGRFPQSDSEVMLSSNARTALHLQLGDDVTLYTPAGDTTFTISGFGCDDKEYYENQTYLVGVYMTQSAFLSLMKQNGIVDNEPTSYVQFQNAKKAKKAIAEFQLQYHLSEESITENTAVMGIAGRSDIKAMKNIYGIAVILFVLVLLAGVLMISGSMNSYVVQRIHFFGMMRCIGASRQQMIRFVRLEALNWCKTAVPEGAILGTLISWSVCVVLRYGIGGYFSTTPVFQISPVGLISGVVVGIATVVLAAQSPAKKAGRVSPISAVSGNIENKISVCHVSKVGFGRIDDSLGIHHAVASKKNWCFITISFSLSILLFLSFSVIMDFAKLLLPSQSPTSADVVLNGYGNEMVFERDLVKKIGDIDGVEAVYGSSYMSGVKATTSHQGIDSINLVSYDDILLDYAKKSVVQGNLQEVYGDSGKVAIVFNKNNPFQIGDTIQIAGTEVEVSCALSQGLFGDELIVICSQKTFDRLMGVQKYGLIGVQLSKDATDETVEEIRTFETDDRIVSDCRESNQQDTATYFASRIIGYSFLSIIGMISMFNIINSISMSVSARTRQYGIMRAVGVDKKQLVRMISAEAVTYSVSGLVVGCGMGIPLNQFLHVKLITHYFGIAWHLPVALLGVVIIFVFASTVIAVYAPSKRICNMVITETINEL